MFVDATLKVGADAIAARITHVQLHSAGAVTSSASECSSARLPVTWSVDSDADLTAGPFAFTGIAANGAVVRLGYWTGLTGGTYCGGVLLTGDATANSSGEYTVDSITETGTST